VPVCPVPALIDRERSENIFPKEEVGEGDSKGRYAFKKRVGKRGFNDTTSQSLEVR
jgi:hypothetical protein